MKPHFRIKASPLLFLVVFLFSAKALFAQHYLSGKITDERNRQPFGYLSGGATLALAENVAGVGSSALCPGRACVGIEVSGSHVKAVSEGDTVTAYARLLHKGSALHVWNVDIKDTSGDLISNVRVTNYIINLQRK